ncbi:TPA_asm: hypothetical protein GJA98_14985 [Listeria monocytogenes]|nr:hypothetical protein [Listeria monocytogenes]
MIYNERCTIKLYPKKEGYLGDAVSTEAIEEEVACSRSKLSTQSQELVFGKFNRKAFILHIQGVHDLESESSEIVYKGIKRSITDVRYHKNKTVVILT